MKTDPEEFKRFYKTLMSNSPDNVLPHLFPLAIGKKDPISSQSWAAPNNRLSLDAAIKYLNMGHNIGIASITDSPLVIVDVDCIDSIPDTDVKPTLSVMTRTRTGRHYFYWTVDEKCKINIPMGAGEIRSNNQYVVCAGSYVRTDTSDMPPDQIEYAGRYTIYNDIAPSQITYAEFPKKFLEYIDQIKTIPQHIPREQSAYKSMSALFDLEIRDVISYPQNQVRFPSPFHGSKTRANTGVSNGLLHCFAHSVTFNAVQAIAVLSGLYTCQQAGKSHHNGIHGPSAVDMRDGNTSFTIWRYAISEGLIPKDDIPPRAALVWFATESGVCREDEVVDGYLPDYAYREAMHLLSTIP